MASAEPSQEEVGRKFMFILLFARPRSLRMRWDRPRQPGLVTLLLFFVALFNGFLPRNVSNLFGVHRGCLGELFSLNGDTFPQSRFVHGNSSRTRAWAAATDCQAGRPTTLSHHSGVPTSNHHTRSIIETADCAEKRETMVLEGTHKQVSVGRVGRKAPAVHE